jgi:hypothetical protein
VPVLAVLRPPPATACPCPAPAVPCDPASPTVLPLPLPPVLLLPLTGPPVRVFRAGILYASRDGTAASACTAAMRTLKLSQCVSASCRAAKMGGTHVTPMVTLGSVGSVTTLRTLLAPAEPNWSCPDGGRSGVEGPLGAAAWCSSPAAAPGAVELVEWEVGGRAPWSVLGRKGLCAVEM